MRQPNPGAYLDRHLPGGAYSHLVDTERYLYAWLHDHNHPLDLYSDLDLHQNPGLLDSYEILMLNGHNEYWSPSNIQILAQAVYLPDVATELDISNCQSRSTTKVTTGGDVIYFDHPGGGGVFGIPSVAAGSAPMSLN